MLCITGSGNEEPCCRKKLKAVGYTELKAKNKVEIEVEATKIRLS